MLKWFKPTWMVESIYDIRPESLKKLNIKVVLTDLDNTLIAWNYPEATDKSIEWINEVKKSGIKVAIISNNSTKRVQKVASVLKLPFIAHAFKPSRRGIRLAQEKFGVDKCELLMVGDQLFTDVLGANRAGVKNVLVKPILASDAWATKFNRLLEMFLMRQMHRRYDDMRWSDSLGE